MKVRVNPLKPHSMWLRPFPERVQGLLWMESRMNEDAFGGVVGMWAIALFLGGLVA